MSKHTSRPTPRKRTAWLWIGLVGVVAAVGATAFWLSPKSGSVAQAADVVVYKTPSCGCCVKWVDHLEDHQMDVSVVNVPTTRGMQSKLGIPPGLRSCHTAKVGDYWVEGHVPADLVKKLITDKPDDIRGISAPGMPAGSPGMEGPNPVQYDIVAYHTDGTTSVYATRQGEEAVK